VKQVTLLKGARTVARLRLGILVDSVSALSPWETRLFDKICRDERLELVVVLTSAFDASSQATRQSSFADRAFKLDAALLARAPEHDAPAFDEALTKAKVWLVTPADAKPGGTVSAETAAAVSNLALDVLLVHGLDDLSTSLCQHAKFGAWWLQHAGQRLNVTAPDQALACIQPGPLVAVQLVTTPDSHNTPRMISSAVFNTERSPATTLTRTAEKSVSLIWRALLRLAGTQKLNFETDGALAARQSRLHSAGALHYGRSLAHTVSNKITKQVAQRAGRHHMRWSLFFGEGAFDSKKLAQMQEAVPAPGEFWADPFLMEKNGETFVFFENYVYGTGRGKISVGVYRDKKLHVLGDALNLPYHLSFPFVFEHEGDMYMMPETSEAKRVEIWKAVEFPLKWKRHSTALEGQSVADPVLFHDENRWWLFANISNTTFEDHCNELHVFEVDGPALKHVTPHPLNPVVIGADTARNAGRIVRQDGKLLRLSQNNSHGIYGYGLNVMEITQLDAGQYQERRVLTVEPTFKPGLIGCHHMDQCGGVFVVDACRRFG
jgi:hypothetical protein